MDFGGNTYTFKCGPVIQPKYYMTWQIQMVSEVSVVGTNVV